MSTGTPSDPNPPGGWAPRSDAASGSSWQAERGPAQAPAGSGPAGTQAPGGSGPGVATADPWWRRARPLAAAVAVVVLVGGLLAAAAIAFLALHGSGDRLTALTPDDSDLYATVMLNPSTSQKLHLNALARKFPDVPSNDPGKQLDSTLQDSLRGSGLSYRDDIKPWLGHQVSLAGRTRGTLDGAPALAMLVDATDEGRATAALDRYRGSSGGRAYDWKRADHGGVTVWAGTLKNRGSGSTLDAASVYAVVDHMAVFANDQGYADEVIDTVQGRHGNLASASGYRQTMRRLPSDWVASAYVNAAPLVGSLRTKLNALGSPGSGGGPDPTSSLAALRGAGMTLAADDNRVNADLDMEIDRTRLDPSARTAQDQPAHVNTTLAVAPSQAFGFLGVGGFKQTVQSLLTQYGSNPQVHDVLQQLGVDTFAGHLTGDLGAEVSPGAGGVPTGALLLGIDDRAAAQAFLDQLVRLANASGGPSTAADTVQPSGFMAVTAADPGAPPGSESLPGHHDHQGGPGSRQRQLRARIRGAGPGGGDRGHPRRGAGGGRRGQDRRGAGDDRGVHRRTLGADVKQRRDLHEHRRCGGRHPRLAQGQ